MLSAGELQVLRFLGGGAGLSYGSREGGPNDIVDARLRRTPCLSFQSVTGPSCAAVPVNNHTIQIWLDRHDVFEEGQLPHFLITRQ
jgi:hypothetical protein